MKNALLLLVLFSVTVTCTTAQAQSEFRQGELSELAINGDTELVVAAPDENASANIDLVENNTNSITAMPVFIATKKYKDVNDFIYSKIEFPEEAREMGLYGVVKVQFEIMADGSIGNLTFLESPDEVFNSEVEKILTSMPNWQPAYSGLVPVKSRYQLNINFSLR